MATKKTARKPSTEAVVQRGLATYLKSEKDDPEGKMTVLVPLALIDGQITVKAARKQGKDLQAFCDSIRQEGLLQPIVVRPGSAKDGGRYELVAGRHRVLAHKLLGLDVIPAIVRKDMSASSGHVAAAIENLQRADIDPWEEACTYAAALEDPKVTRKALAERVGVNPSTVTQRMKLHALGPKHGPWAVTLRQEDLEILAAFHEHPELMDAACKAARNNSLGWSVRDRVTTAFRDRDDVCMPNEPYFIHKHAGVHGWDETNRLENNPTYRKELKALPGLKVGGGHRVMKFCLDPKAARAACHAAGERMRAAQKGSASRAVATGSGGVDIEKRAQNRAVKAQDEAMAKHLKGIVSFGDDWTQAFLKRWLKSEGLIASTKAKRAAFAELTGIASWNGRAEDLVPHIEKAGWGTPEAGRILAGALHFCNASVTPYVSDPAAHLTTGKTWKGLLDKATRDVKAELKEAEERKKVKEAKKKPAKKAAKKTAKKVSAAKVAERKANLAEQKAKPHACVWGPCRERYENADDLLEHDKVCPVRLKHEAKKTTKKAAPAKIERGSKAAKAVHDIHTGQASAEDLAAMANGPKPKGKPGKECSECLVIIKAKQRKGKRHLICSCTSEHGVVA